mgnify:CR=1 FL=1
MAISTYSELKTAVANWINRDDLTDRIPEFIALAEARFNRMLRVSAMEGLYTADTVKAQRNYNLPPRYLQMRSLRLNRDPLVVLTYLTPEMMDRVWAGSAVGIPKAYTIKANDIFLGPAPSSVYEMEMDYFRKFDALSTSNATNWVMINAPDVYLYGSLLEAEPFIMNDKRMALWAASFYKAIDDIQLQNDKDRYSGSEMRVMNTSGYP